MEEDSIIYKVKELNKCIIKNLVPSDEHHHVSPSQIQIIELLLKSEENFLYQKDLEKKLNIRRSTISDILQRMEKNNLIIKTGDEKDSRTKKITLSESAVNHFNIGKNKLISLEKKIKNNISDEDLKTFIKVVNNIIDNIENKENK